MKTKLSTFCDKIIEAGWLAAVVVVPLFFNIYSARTFEPDKITLLRSIVVIMVLAWIIAAVEKVGGAADAPPVSLAGRVRRWLKIPLVLPTALLVSVYLISTIFSLSPQVSLWGSYQRMQGTYTALSYMTVFALIAGNLRTREQADRLVTTIIVASIPVSLYGIVQHYGLDPLPWAGDVTQRVAANMGNAIFVASYLTMIVPLTLSRLIEAMAAIIKEEKASWGYTILAAIYIFILAIQIITIIFSQSRGPMIGILVALFVMGLLLLLLLRRFHANLAGLSIKEVVWAVVFVLSLLLAGGLGLGVGYGLGYGLRLLFQIDALPFLGAVLGGLLGFLGLYTVMAAAGKGWRWLWLSWFSIAVLGIIFVLALNMRGTPLDPYLDPIRQIPYVGRLAQLTGTEGGTGKVRVLIWDAAWQLITPHQPLGIPGDDVSPADKFNAIRPLVGYGPESMFNAFAFVYPPDLAHIEARGSSADRSHNETMDSLVIIGLLGFAAFYFLMVSLFYYTLRWLGWAPDRGARWRLLILLLMGGLAGAAAAFLTDFDGGSFTFIAVGLPFGVAVGVVLHLSWQGLVRQKQDDGKVEFSAHPLLLIGLLGAIVGHFIEVHFVFSIAATYTYFWVYAGLMVALARMSQPKETPVALEAELSLTTDTAAALEVDLTEPALLDSKMRRSRKNRLRRTAKKGEVGPTRFEPVVKGETWETWVGSQGLTMAIILIILTFDFVTPQFQLFANADSLSLLWMYLITWSVGLAIALSDVAIRRESWSSPLGWGRATLIYLITSGSYFFFYYIAHRIQFSQQIRVNNITDIITAANVLAYGLVLFYIFLFLLLTLLALMLSWRQMRRLLFWRAENWWLYPPLVVAALAFIWFKNIDVVRADIYLKDGERYRNQSQWDQAITLHEMSRSIDSDEDFYNLMLALDYQLMAQDGRLSQEIRANAWRQGEEIALAARRINPYNPDNTGNMGRYYFTVGQVFDPGGFQKALTFFDKAVALAPSNVVYHNLWAQTLYILQKYDEAIERLKISLSLDSSYSPTWLLLGDTYAAKGNVDNALKAHLQAIRLSNDFFDQFLDQRLNFYISAQRSEDIIAAIQQAALDRPTDPMLPQAIGRAYQLAGKPQQATTYFEQARALGDASDRTIRNLANIYLTAGSFDQALPLYQGILQSNPNDIEAHSALAFIYARQGRLPEALQENQQVLQQSPNDYASLKNMAVLYQQMGQLPNALTYAQQSLTVAPEADRPSWQQFIADIQNRITPTMVISP